MLSIPVGNPVTGFKGIIAIVQNPSGSTIGAFSTDGSTWNPVTLPNLGYSDVTWGGDAFVAVAGASAPGSSAYSLDGTTWTAKVVPDGTEFSPNSVAWNGSLFCTVGPCNVTPHYCATNPDGATGWSPQTTLSSGGDPNIYEVCWIDTKFVAISGGYEDFTSADGITWAHSVAFTSQFGAALAWNGTVLVQVGQTGLHTSNANGVSSNGTSWTYYTNMPSMQWIDVASDGSNFCAVGCITDGFTQSPTDKCATSTDGVTWAQQTMNSSHVWGKICWTGSFYAVVAQDADIVSTSPDGITWTDTALPSAGGGAWFAIGSTGNL